MNSPDPTNPRRSADVKRDNESIILSGRLDAGGAASIWKAAVKSAQHKTRNIDLSGVDYLDGAGTALILTLKDNAAKAGNAPTITGAREEHSRLLTLYGETHCPEDCRKGAKECGICEQTGRESIRLLRDMRSLLIFVGEGTVALVKSLRHPSRIRWKDYIHVCETAGVNALPIVALIGFLMGLITAFQSAVPMRRFGADIYVANLLGLSMLRELGPLVTAILLAGRSGSAFAAEIGTMVINEEVSALRTMGLSPVQFLMVPRLLATMTVTPILTMFFNLFALIGGAVVVTGLGYPLVTYSTRALSYVSNGDVLGGLFKALVFSMLVAGIGCQRGLTTGSGASAVGESTTSSVVTGLVLIAVSDGILASIYYALGI